MFEPAVDHGIQPIRIHHLVHIADAVCLLRRKALARQKVAVRRPRAHGAQHIRADGGRDKADLHLAQAKACGIHRHRHVAASHQAHATGINIALHARNRGLGAFVDGAQHLGQQTGVHAVFIAGVIGHAAHPVQIGTRAKGRTFGRQHHGTYIGALTHLVKGGGNFGNAGIAEGVANLGLGQRDAGNATIHGQGQSGHGLSPIE